MNVPWSAMPDVVLARDVVLTLANGSLLRGTVVAVEADRLIVAADGLIIEGDERQAIPRSDVKTLQVIRPVGTLWRAIGALAGAVAGASIVVGIVLAKGILSPDIPSKDGAAGIVAAVSAGGFFAGWAADHHQVTVVVTQ
jgi:hypothetical protein